MIENITNFFIQKWDKIMAQTISLIFLRIKEYILLISN